MSFLNDPSEWYQSQVVGIRFVLLSWNRKNENKSTEWMPTLLNTHVLLRLKTKFSFNANFLNCTHRWTKNTFINKTNLRKKKSKNGNLEKKWRKTDAEQMKMTKTATWKKHILPSSFNFGAAPKWKLSNAFWISHPPWPPCTNALFLPPYFFVSFFSSTLAVDWCLGLPLFLSFSVSLSTPFFLQLHHNRVKSRC